MKATTASTVRHLHFTQSLEPLNGGGLGSSTVALHRQMRARGLHSVLCSTHGGEPQRESDGALEFRRLKPDMLYYSPELWRRGRDLVRGADIVQGHGLYVGTNLVFGLEARRQRKPLVYHVHGMFEPYILNRSRWKKRLVHWLFEDDNFRHVSLWRALTPKEADQIRSLGIFQPIVVAPNGLDPSEFRRPDEPFHTIETPWIPALEKTARRMLFLARIHPKKGLDLLLSALQRLGSAGREWELVIAGPDEGGHLSEIRALAESLGLLDRVRFTGPVTGLTKVQLLHSADLFVLPSYSEGFPMGILEAMACSVPVVATRECNCPDVTAALAGWECDARVESLAEALGMALLACDQERQQRGRNGRRVVEERYAWPRIINELVAACADYC